MPQVRIRFLGDNFRKGIPLKRHIDVGGHRFYNWPRFPEQLADGSYIRDREFYEANKEILNDRHIFLVDFLQEVKGALTPKGLPPGESDNGDAEEVAKFELPEELEEKGVIEVDGEMGCPECDFTTRDVNKMGFHMTKHEA